MRMVLGTLVILSGLVLGTDQTDVELEMRIAARRVVNPFLRHEVLNESRSVIEYSVLERLRKRRV